jgi:hypothetical protein
MIHTIKNPRDAGLNFETFKYVKLISSAYYDDRIEIMFIAESFRQEFRKNF